MAKNRKGGPGGDATRKPGGTAPGGTPPRDVRGSARTFETATRGGWLSRKRDRFLRPAERRRRVLSDKLGL